MTQKKDKGALYVIIWLTIVVVVSAFAILWGKDDYNGVEMSGFEVIPLLYPSFWALAAISLILGLALAYAAYAIYVGIGWFKNIRGEFTYIWVAALAAILLSAPWGYVGGVKANGGLILPKKQAYVPTSLIDTLIIRGWQCDDIKWVSTIDIQEFKDAWAREAQKLNRQ